jgi:hypothetical protein
MSDPAWHVYGLRIAKSAFGYKSLGQATDKATKRQHCRTEVYIREIGASDLGYHSDVRVNCFRSAFSRRECGCASVDFVQAQRIITNSTAPAISTNFTSDSHFSTNTFRTREISFLKNGPMTFPSRPFSSTNYRRAIVARAAVPLPSPFHGREFHGCARRGRALALRERLVFVGFQCFR